MAGDVQDFGLPALLRDVVLERAVLGIVSGNGPRPIKEVIRAFLLSLLLTAPERVVAGECRQAPLCRGARHLRVAWPRRAAAGLCCVGVGAVNHIKDEYW